jgi:hypothetical protein
MLDLGGVPRPSRPASGRRAAFTFLQAAARGLTRRVPGLPPTRPSRRPFADSLGQAPGSSPYFPALAPPRAAGLVQSARMRPTMRCPCIGARAELGLTAIREAYSSYPAATIAHR